MKLFKKLLAAALAGVLALTLLTGCSGMVNKSQLVDALNAMHFLNDPDYPEVKTIVQGDSKLATQLLNNVATYIAEHPDSYYSANSALYEYDELDYMLGSNRVCPKDTKDLYYYTWLRLDDPQSKEFQQNRAYHIAESLKSLRYQDRDHTRTLNKEDPDTHLCTYSDTATASIATKKIGEYEYLAIVFVQKCTGENTARSY